MPILYLSLNISNLPLVKIGYLARRSAFRTEWGHFYVLKSSRYSGSSEEPLLDASASAGNFEVTKTSPSSKHCNSLILLKSPDSSAWFTVQQESVRGLYQRGAGCSRICQFYWCATPQGRGKSSLGSFHL